MVIAVAPSAAERVQLAATLAGMSPAAPVLMVASAGEAVALLAGLEQVSVPVAVPPPVAVPTAPPPPTADPELSVDSDGRILGCRGRAVTLSPLEHDLIVCLLEDVGRTWAYDELHRRVWGNDHLGDRSDVQSVVKRLRHKLRRLDSPLHLDVVRGVGLRLVPRRPSPTNCPTLPTACPPLSIAAVGRRP
ncbi:hypothetical protein GCM10023340_04800 [Nocardioides marinquilinus]|uniref:OmpR/PhoB-type domain-containing protein n=2 Tax=Nocardioides marinquilinus TaxID=1210400 RepID=A0ABP9P7P0_9ACTN